MKRLDLIAAAALAGLASFVLFESRNLTFGSLRVPQTGFFPRVLGILLVLLALGEIVRVLRLSEPAPASEKIASEGDTGVSSFVGEELTKSDRPELTAAKIIISGGRALGSHENLEKLIYPIADKLGAAVGASRAAGITSSACATGISSVFILI